MMLELNSTYMAEKDFIKRGAGEKCISTATTTNNNEKKYVNKCRKYVCSLTGTKSSNSFNW